jgi:hypothetical protein
MKNFANELFSIQLDPPRGRQGSTITYAAYEDGTFLVSTSAPFSMEELFTSCECFRLLKSEDLQALFSFAKKEKEIFLKSPDMLSLPNYTGSSFTFCLNGTAIYGSYHRIDLLRRVEGGDKDPTLWKIMEWDNKVVDFVEDFFKMVKTFDNSKMEILGKAKEKEYLRPVPRFLFHLLHEDESVRLPCFQTKDECIKAAAKKAFEGSSLPEGAIYNACFSLIKKEALNILGSSNSRPEFDKSHSFLTNEIVTQSGGTIDFAQAAYWLDLAYAYFLLTEELILSETKAALLHAPVSPKTLLEENKTADQTSYLFFQNEGRKEWSLLHISPIYFYFEGIYSVAHPLQSKTQDNRA